ncbi:2OG-Fe(II) oxygenase [Moumouvirus australiensis]|uniref:2OG-Fe(II) oxygenase n=1 Tax=Moumouvirus australiensis TaxID=2109587 RepID=A0A2P1EMK1_9VIRU|nr:2OG-Fe(II) oxygenase [Moumouvirus australiensis]AVL95136.1 2OG-Fe(II) oxygenase [Moumouvirus australiensis]
MENAIVLYNPQYIDKIESEKIFDSISDLFKNESRKKVFDKHNFEYTLKRKTMVFVDKDVDKNIVPKIWGDNVKIMDFTPELFNIKRKLETELNFKFNICLANYYNTGKNSIGWHSDNEEKGSTSCIASFSFGSERLFSFRKKNSGDISLSLKLNNGSLLVMGSGCQENYEHSLRNDKTCHEPRLNLTFRLFDSERYFNH